MGRMRLVAGIIESHAIEPPQSSDNRRSVALSGASSAPAGPTKERSLVAHEIEEGAVAKQLLTNALRPESCLTFFGDRPSQLSVCDVFVSFQLLFAVGDRTWRPYECCPMAACKWPAMLGSRNETSAMVP